jgi:hypothetical protein
VNAIDVAGGAPVLVGDVRPVGDQAPVGDHVAKWVRQRNLIAAVHESLAHLISRDYFPARAKSAHFVSRGCEDFPNCRSRAERHQAVFILARVAFPNRAFQQNMRTTPPRRVAQSGSAPRSGPGGRRFKSCHSDQKPLAPGRRPMISDDLQTTNLGVGSLNLFGPPFGRGSAQPKMVS